jgi:GAF domain-containing protein/HAMP domain-containing protein
VKNSMFKVVGIVRARFDLTIFNETASRNKNIAQNGSFPILLGENLLRLADPYGAAFYKLVGSLPEGAYQPLIDAKKLPNLPIAMLHTDLPLMEKSLATIETEPVFTGDLLNNGTMYIGAAATMTRRPWMVAYFQEEDVFMKPVETNLRNNQFNIALLQFVANILVLVFTTLLVRPITNLTTAAQKLAEGDFDVQAKVKSGDEVQTLAESFNSMTGQIRLLVTDLEGRVQERTVELAQQTEKSAFRVVQLQAVADVARTVASVKDLEGIFTAVTRLVTERFNYYHSGIFLIDGRQEYAVLRAATSEGGMHMLARGHKLLVGQVGIVGYVAATGKSRIATDVGEDAMFFNNPDLPLTRSEMALPLSSEGRVIGVLDIQSTDANAFTEDDISLFLTLADQVSVAIVNNRLFEETHRALLEAQALHNQYLSEEWQKRTEEQGWQGYQYSLKGLKPSPFHSNPQILSAIQSGEPCAAMDENEDKNMLAIPIKVRGQVIGVIDMQQAEHHPWHEDEIGLAQAIADQVGTALENARLLDQTLRRAQRERRALDITNKIRAVNDPQTMIEVALAELQKSLGVSQAQILIQTSKIENNGNGYHGDGKV